MKLRLFLQAGPLSPTEQVTGSTSSTKIAMAFVVIFQSDYYETDFFGEAR